MVCQDCGVPVERRQNHYPNHCDPCKVIYRRASALRRYHSTYAPRQHDAYVAKRDARPADQELCDSCGRRETALTGSGTVKRLARDHCHTTGMKRGRLCQRCNIAIGQMQDDPDLLRLAAAYLERGTW